MVSDSCKKRFGKIMLEQMELLEQVEIAPQIFSMRLRGQMVSQMQVGQFLHIPEVGGSPGQEIKTILANTVKQASVSLSAILVVSSTLS